MKRLIKALIRLYPPAWRSRYGLELETLIEDTGGRWAPIPDILLEALKMRITTINWRLSSSFVLAGLAITVAVAFRMPDHYQSTATIRTEPGPQGSAAILNEENQAIIRNALSRSSLAMLIQKPGHVLYPEALRTIPLENIIEDMKSNDLKIATVPQGIEVSYRGLTPHEAQETVRVLVTRLLDEHHSGQRSLVGLLAQAPIDSATAAKLSIGSRMELEAPPSLPRTRLNAWRPMIIASGALLGLVALFCCAVLRRNPRVWLYAGIAITLISAIPYELAMERDLPILSYQSQATLVFDSQATRQAITTDPGHLFQELENPARFRIQFIPDGSKYLILRGTYHQRFELQHAIQSAITKMDEELKAQQEGFDMPTWKLNGPWMEVLDPPSLPIYPRERELRDGILTAGLMLTGAAAIILLLDRLRRTRRATLQPASGAI